VRGVAQPGARWKRQVAIDAVMNVQSPNLQTQKPTMPDAKHLSFETQEHLSKWLKTNHASEHELWVRIYKKQSGTASVTWEDCVVASLAWGWIDGQKKSLDDQSFLQRLTPRHPVITPSQA
jgi:uncharacterized protein YdeI (YjbR/CyaY-like superfamily)